MRKGFIVFDLRNKTALGTGGASGIGAAVGAAFVQACPKVWRANRDEANGRAVAERFNAELVVLDVSSKADGAFAAQKVGNVDVLANIAGIGHVSDHCQTRPRQQAPFGGFKHSGVGNEFGTFGIEVFLEPRATLSDRLHGPERIEKDDQP